MNLIISILYSGHSQSILHTHHHHHIVNSKLLLCFVSLGNIFDDVSWSRKFLSIAIGYLKAELILDGHDHLDVIQRVETEVLNEV